LPSLAVDDRRESPPVDVAALIISIFAILIAGGSLYYTRRADQRAARAESRGRRASLFVRSGGSEHVPGQLLRTFNLLIGNRGPSSARHVRLWLTDRARQQVSTEIVLGYVLSPTDAPQVAGSLELQVPVEVADLELWASYVDDDGPHTERLDDVQLS
jgi:hypothetical protein